MRTLDVIELVFWSSIGVLVTFYIAYYILMVFSARKPNNIKKSPITPLVTLIIPTYNEEEVIVQKLNNVKELEYPRKLIEVIVIDSASTDDTPNLVQDFINENIDELNILLVKQESREGKARALNDVWGLCNGDILILSDADSLLHEDALRQVASNFADASVGAVSGRQVLLNTGQSLATGTERSYRSLFEIIRIGESRLDSTPIFHGELAAFRRNLIEGVSSDSVADDTELAIKVREKGYKAVYDPDAKFYEYAPPSLRARLKQKRRRGLGLIQQFIRFKYLIFNLAYGKYGFIILPSEFFMHIVSPILLLVLAISFVLMIITNPFRTLIAIISAALLVTVMGLLIFSKSASPSKRIPNPLTTLFAFLHSQMCLLLSLLSMVTGKSDHRWEKIEEIRSSWKVSS